VRVQISRAALDDASRNLIHARLKILLPISHPSRTEFIPSTPLPISNPVGRAVVPALDFARAKSIPPACINFALCGIIARVSGDPMFEQAFKNIDDVLRKEAGCTDELAEPRFAAANTHYRMPSSSAVNACSFAFS
jgi:hypothetical protein